MKIWSVEVGCSRLVQGWIVWGSGVPAGLAMASEGSGRFGRGNS